MIGGTGEIKRQKCGIPECRRLGTDWLYPEGADNGSGNGSGKRRRDGISDLAGAVPFGQMGTEPIGKAMQTCHLTDGNATGVTVMDGARAGERPARAVRACPQCVGNPVFGEPEEATDRFDSPRFSGCEAATRDFGVPGSGA